MMNSRNLIRMVLGYLAASLLVTPISLRAQEPAQGPKADPLFEWGALGSSRNLRPSGMPVIPIFDGWINNGDGTADLCFGYKSLNLEERRDIPLGADNFIEPARYDGVQPTFFLEVPPGWMRQYCVFNVRVPMGSEPVYWTLKHNGFEYKTPGHTGSINYILDNEWHSSDRGTDGEGGKMAPLLEFLEPSGTSHIGRAGAGARSDRVTARVGAPVTLSVAVTQPEIEEYTGHPKTFNVYWAKYQGPAGAVTFAEERIRLQGGDAVERKVATTSATFHAPGHYILIVQVLQSTFESQCCWTNGYVEVTVVE
jgi:hypothetical protein